MSRNEIVTETDLVTAVEDALKRRGIYDRLKAKIRAEVFHVLDDKTVPMTRTDREIPHDLFLVRELVKEFLQIMKLENTLSVFCKEMGPGTDSSVDRSFLGSELGLNVSGSDERLPLLILLTQFLKRNREDFLQNMQISSSMQTEREAESERVRERESTQHGSGLETLRKVVSLSPSFPTTRRDEAVTVTSSRSPSLAVETQTLTETERQTQIETERKAQIETERQAQIETERQAQIETERQAQRETERQAQIETGSDADHEQSLRSSHDEYDDEFSEAPQSVVANNARNVDQSMAEQDYSYSFFADSQLQ